MSRLRIAEDRRKFTFYRLPQEEREKIAAKLAEILREREEVEVALVFGGFVTSEVFRDIDVAVFTAYRVEEDRDYLYEDELAEQLGKATGGIPVHVVMLDYAPPKFTVTAIKQGKILVERKPGLIALLRWAAQTEINDFQAKREKLLGTTNQDKQTSQKTNNLPTGQVHKARFRTNRTIINIKIKKYTGNKEDF